MQLHPLTDHNNLLRQIHDATEVYTGLHFVYTGEGQNRDHGDAYINYRNLKEPEHQALLAKVSLALIRLTLNRLKITESEPVTVIGPETLGAQMVEALTWSYNGKLNPVILVRDENGLFVPKAGSYIDLAKRSPRIFMDDLLNDGKTTRKVQEVIGIDHPLRAITVIGDRSGRSAANFGVEVVASLEQFQVARYNPHSLTGCPLCQAKVPIVLRPGHGHAWQELYPDYPGGYVTLEEALSAARPK